MAQAANPPRGSAREARLRSVEAKVTRLARRLARDEARLRALGKAVAARARREEVLLRALGLDPSARRGDRGAIGELDAAVAGLEEYLLKTGDRIESILKILAAHRESLERMSKKLEEGGNRELLRTELDVMKVTLATLAMAGVEFDANLVADIDELKKALEEGKASPEELRRRKGELDKRYAEELQRYDLSALYGKRSKIPGYG